MKTYYEMNISYKINVDARYVNCFVDVQPYQQVFIKKHSLVQSKKQQKQGYRITIKYEKTTLLEDIMIQINNEVITIKQHLKDIGWYPINERKDYSRCRFLWERIIMPKLKEQIEIEMSLTRQEKKHCTSSSSKNVCDLWFQSLKRIKDVCKDRNRF